MKYYIIDDNIATVKSLENIIKSKGLGTVVGYSTDPIVAMKELSDYLPDIVLVDLLMEKKDGITLVEELKEQNDKFIFVMISKVSDKEMIQRAYTAGIEFFVNKPVNIVEVERVLANVSEKVKMREIVGNIRHIFEEPETEPDYKQTPSVGNDIDIILGSLGMLGEKGVQDIHRIFSVMLETGEGYHRDILDNIAKNTGDTAKNINQRIGRAIRKGMTNAAAIGLDDYSDEVYTVYAGYVFDFKTLKDEMNRIEGRSSCGGRVNTAKFFDGLMLYYNS